MRILVWLAAIAAACVAAPCAAAPLEAYGKLPNIEEVAISADGARLGIIWTDGEERRVVIRDLRDGSTKVLGVGKAKVRNLAWAGSDHLLIETSTTSSIAFTTARRAEYFLLSDYDLRQGKLRRLLNDTEDSLNIVAGAPHIRTVKGKVVVVVEGVHFVEHEGQRALFQIDLETGRSRLSHPGFRRTNGWVVGRDGEPLAETEYNGETGLWLLKVKNPTGWAEVKSLMAMFEPPHLLGLGRDGTSILVAEPLGERTALREISAVNPVWSEPFRTGASHPPLHDPAGHNLIGFHALVDDEQQYEFLDPQAAATWAAVVRAYKGSQVVLASWSDDRSRVVVRVESPTEGPSYAIVDFKAKRADPIGFLYDGVTAADIAPVRSFRFKAGDGLTLSGYLTLPKGRDPKGLPLVVLAHGGPAARDEPGFDWWSQALASRGYAVLQVNYRGSDGFSRAFLEAGFGQWGRKMQTDLSDGVRHLVDEGVIDPARVCITGASYGGYAALAGAAFDSKVYRCAADVSGPADLRRFVAWSKEQHGFYSQRYWERFMGADDPKDPKLDQISPALHADQVTIPILLVHGKDDTVVPIEQTYVMEKALKAAGKSVETVIMPGEDHWLSRGETRLRMLQSVVAFLEKNNPPQ